MVQVIYVASKAIPRQRRSSTRGLYGITDKIIRSFVLRSELKPQLFWVEWEGFLSVYS
jgi:hypothetical protein